MGGIREYPSPLLCQITFRKIYSGERSPRRLGFSCPPKPPSGNSLSAFQFSAEPDRKIRKRLETAKSCTVFESDLERIWPREKAHREKRERAVLMFARTNGW